MPLVPLVPLVSLESLELKLSGHTSIPIVTNGLEHVRNAVFLRPEEFVGDFWSEIPPDGDCAYNCQNESKI